MIVGERTNRERHADADGTARPAGNGSAGELIVPRLHAVESGPRVQVYRVARRRSVLPRLLVQSGAKMDVVSTLVQMRAPARSFRRAQVRRPSRGHEKSNQLLHCIGTGCRAAIRVPFT